MTAFEQLGVTEGYTEEDLFRSFKEAAFKGNNQFLPQISKAGCENEFRFCFIETEPTLYLPNFG